MLVCVLQSSFEFKGSVGMQGVLGFVGNKIGSEVLEEGCGVLEEYV